MTVEVPYLGNYNKQTDFVKIKKLGEGAFGSCYAVHPREHPKVTVVLKVCDKSKFKSKACKAMIQREIEIHSQVLSPYVTTLIHSFEDKKAYYMVLEYAPYGDLFALLRHRVDDMEDEDELVFSETEIRKIITCVCKGLMWLHEHSILHRDLKLENLLVYDVEKWLVKISDFGHSHYINDWQHTFGATTVYVSPEEVNGHERDATEKSEVWKVGILMYELAFGSTPFEGEAEDEDDNEEETMENISSGLFEFPDTPEVSKELKSLIYRCLTVDVRKRPSLEDVLNSTFFTKK